MTSFKYTTIAIFLAIFSTGCVCFGPSGYEAEHSEEDTVVVEHDGQQYEYHARVDMLDDDTIPVLMPNQIADAAFKVTEAASEMYDKPFDELYSCMANPVTVVVPDDDFSNWTQQHHRDGKGRNYDSQKAHSSTAGFFTNDWCFSLGGCEYAFILKQGTFEDTGNTQRTLMLVAHELTHRASHCATGDLDEYHSNTTNWINEGKLSTSVSHEKSVFGIAVHALFAEYGYNSPTYQHYTQPTVVDCDVTDCSNL